MRAIKLVGQVNGDHTLRLDLPADVPEGPAEVIVLVPDGQAQQAGTSLREFLRDAAGRAGQGKTREEIDRYLEAERGSWG